MKMLKSIKKLKFWHRKKKKKKPYLPPPPPPPPPCCCCSFPSAPPLPPWYDADQAYEAAASGFAYTTQQQEEIVSEAAALPSYPLNSTSSYQQYMVLNPVYGIPAVPVPVPAAPTKEKSATLFGCAFEIGRYLFRCFFPCFRVREAR